jgi:hypothetical protein
MFAGRDVRPISPFSVAFMGVSRPRATSDRSASCRLVEVGVGYNGMIVVDPGGNLPSAPSEFSILAQSTWPGKFRERSEWETMSKTEESSALSEASVAA